MRDITQEVFDGAEDMALSLHHIAGCEDALVALLDGPLAALPDRGRSVYAQLAAIAAFRAQAEALAGHLARLAAG